MKKFIMIILVGVALGTVSFIGCADGAYAPPQTGENDSGVREDAPNTNGGA